MFRLARSALDSGRPQTLQKTEASNEELQDTLEQLDDTAPCLPRKKTHASDEGGDEDERD
jgi:hypothetical protein